MGSDDSVSLTLTPGEQTRGWDVRWRALQAEVVEITQRKQGGIDSAAVEAASQRLHEFFVSAYHLKDVLIQQAPAGLTKSAVEGAVTASPVLSLLADLANTDKHFVLNKPPRSGAAPTVSTAATSDGTSWRLDLTIHHNGAHLDGWTFAHEAVTAWRDQLTQWGLL